MATVLNVELTNDEWLDLNTETGIAVGTEMNIQNQGDYSVWIQESATEPATLDEGQKISTMGLDYATPKVKSGSLKIWVRCVSPQGSTLGVQEAV